MSHSLSKYENDMFSKLLTLEYNNYYTIRKDRPDYEEFMIMLKKRIDIYQDFMFTEDYSKFTRIQTVEELTSVVHYEFDNGIKIGYTFIPFSEQQAVIESIEYNLPITIKARAKKELDLALGRK